jgi:hypothetical protein
MFFLAGTPAAAKGYTIPLAGSMNACVQKDDDKQKEALRSNVFSCRDARGSEGICNPSRSPVETFPEMSLRSFKPVRKQKSPLQTSNI